MSITRKEWCAVAFTVSAAFFTLMGYELVRTTSMVLFKQTYGAEYLPVVMAIMPWGLLLGLYVYGHLITWVGPRKTLASTGLGFIAIFVLCYWAIEQGVNWATGMLFIVKEFYIVLLIEQYWSFINSSISQKTARKLNGPILGITAISGAIGGFTVFGLAEKLGTLNLLLIAAVLLLPAILLANLGYLYAGEPKLESSEEKVQSSGYLGLKEFKRHPLLIYLLGVVVLTQVFSTLIELRFQELLSGYFTSADQEAAFQGQFYGSLQVFILGVQFIVLPLLLTTFKWKIGGIQLFIPIVHCITCFIAIIYPSIWTVGLSLFLFKSLDYSLFRASKEILYIPLTFNIRYRAKEFIDVFGYRCSKGLTSLGVIAFRYSGVMVSQFYTAIALLASLGWLSLIFSLLKEIRKEKLDDTDISSQK